MPTPRTTSEVDTAIAVQQDSRRRQLNRIQELLQVVADLRGDYARAGRRIDALLEEREALMHAACPDSPAGLDTEDAS